MSTEERDLEENKGGKPQEEEFKPKNNKEEKAIDDSEMKEIGEEERLGRKDSTDQCNADDDECPDEGEAA